MNLTKSALIMVAAFFLPVILLVSDVLTSTLCSHRYIVCAVMAAIMFIAAYFPCRSMAMARGTTSGAKTFLKWFPIGLVIVQILFILLELNQC